MGTEGPGRCAPKIGHSGGRSAFLKADANGGPSILAVGGWKWVESCRCAFVLSYAREKRQMSVSFRTGMSSTTQHKLRHSNNYV
jgi:hypothetical protein